MAALIKHFIRKSPAIHRFNQPNRRCLHSNVLSNVCRRLYSTDKFDKHYDIIIVGGGPAGISMACSISKNGKLSDRQVLVLNGTPKFNDFNADKYSNRVYAINKGTVSLMESIDVWDKVVNTRCQPVKQMQVWDACSDAIITLNHDNFSEDMAYIVENDLLMSALLQQLELNPNVVLKSSTSISSVQLPKDGCDNSGVTLKTGERYSCELLDICFFLSYIQSKTIERNTISSMGGCIHMTEILQYCGLKKIIFHHDFTDLKHLKFFDKMYEEFDEVNGMLLLSYRFM